MSKALDDLDKLARPSPDEERLVQIFEADRRALTRFRDKLTALCMLDACGDVELAVRFAKRTHDPEVVDRFVRLGLAPEQLSRAVEVGDRGAPIRDLLDDLDDDQLRAVLGAAGQPSVCSCGEWDWQEAPAGWTCAGCGLFVDRNP